MEHAAPGENVDLSIVIPVYNEVDNVRPLVHSVNLVLKNVKGAAEVVIVDDGSEDGTWEALSEATAGDPRWTRIQLRRNFGQTAALSAGFHHARGNIVVTLDGDLQNDPADIPMLMEAMEGFDIVSGWRKDRKDRYLTRRVPSMLANWLISKVTGVRLHDSGCTLKAYRAEVLQNLHLYGEMHRFIPALASAMGVRVREVVTRHHPRRAGKSKYGIGRIVRVALDLITVKFLLSYLTRPIQVFGLPGLFSVAAGLGISGYLTVLKLGFGQEIGHRPLLLLGVLLLVLGTQLIVLGLLGEMISRVYHEQQKKLTYVVRSVRRG